MLDLNQMSVFIKVVQEGSFTAAARSLSIPKSRVSRMITDLEDKLNERLLERTTREIRPTDIGLQYFTQYKPLFEEIVDIHEQICDKHKEANGHLRISAPVGFAIELMGRWMAGFKAAFPLITIELVFNDGGVHLIKNGFDVGFAIGEQEDSSLIARKIDDTDPVVSATAQYIAKHGPFDHPSQLNDVPWVDFGSRQGHTHNSCFIHKETGERVEVQKKSSVIVNHHEIHKQHMLAGQGAGICSSFMNFREITQGRLNVILPQWQIEQEPLYLVFPSGKHQPKKVRCFIDYIVAESKKLEDFMSQCESLDKQEQLAFINQYFDKPNIEPIAS